MSPRSRKKPHKPLITVFDTNVIISAVLFRSGRLKPLRDAWQNRQVTPVVSKETSQELLEVLSYPKFGLKTSDIEQVLALYMPYVQTHVIEQHANRMAHIKPCRDPRDQKFLELAQSAEADCLITGDDDLLALDDVHLKHHVFRTVTPAAMIERLGVTP